MELVAEFLKRIARSNREAIVHVIGDPLIDENYQVNVSRLSPECSNINVLRLFEENAKILPGGAANVCYQLKHFNSRSRLFAFLSNKDFHKLKSCGINYWGQVLLPNTCSIPVKRRFYDNGLQSGCRLDIEKDNYGLSFDDLRQKQAAMATLWSAFQAEPDVIIFADYDKGIFVDNLFMEMPTHVSTIVDPKNKPIHRWKGCTVFKLNAKEAVDLSNGLTDWRKQSDYFKKELSCEAVIITRSGEGIFGKADDYFEYKPSKAISVSNVSGAGDCFTAMLALALVHKFNFYEAAVIAFEIGFKYVQHPSGTAIAPWDLGVKDLDVKFLRDRNFKLVFTNGCFDILHLGHKNTLEYAKSKGDKLLVALDSDDNVKRLKGESRPINCLADRKKMLESFEMVDFVCGFDNLQELISKIVPEVLVKGSDWQGKEIIGQELVNEIYFAPFIEGKSTSSIIKQYL